MKSLEQLYSELKSLSADFEALLAAKSEAHDRQTDFTAVKELSRKTPVNNDTLSKLSEPIQIQYLRLLCTAAGLDGEITIDQLLYLCRLAAGAKCQRADPESMLSMAYQTEHLDWQAAALELKGAALPLLLDLLMTVHLADRTPELGLEFAADLAALLGCGDADLSVCAQLASALLTQDFEAFKSIQAAYGYSELGYAVPEKWLDDTRVRLAAYQNRREDRASRKKHPQYWMYPESVPVIIFALSQWENNDFVPPCAELLRFQIGFKDAVLPQYAYDFPYCDPIYAPKQGGFVQYIVCGDNEQEVWFTSAFDRNWSDKS